jgi:[acyl-carrier-protein] S-malonyltransferase
MKDIVFLFDGQGAFRPGMGKDLCNKYPKARKIIDTSGEILGYDLAEYLWGNKASGTADQTSIAQPAISTVSLAYAGVLSEHGLTATVSLGHSLGEVTAMVYCGVVSFSDGIKMIQKRGEVMEAGGGQGTMMAVLNIERPQLERMCEEVSEDTSDSVVVANINAPDQIVISGSKEGVKRVAQLVAEKKGRGIPLQIGGAWHSPYLRDAAEDFSKFLDGIEFKKPMRQFYSVVEQAMLESPAAIKDSLKNQMLSQVNWVRAMENVRDKGYSIFLEIGPSKILKNLAAKIDPAVRVDSTALYTDLDRLIEVL